jgi:hypothetical protein
MVKLGIFVMQRGLFRVIQEARIGSLSSQALKPAARRLVGPLVLDDTLMRPAYFVRRNQFGRELEFPLMFDAFSS